MARIIHLENNPGVAKTLARILKKEGHSVTSVYKVDEVSNGFDLYICGSLNKYSDGLLMAAEYQGRGAKVLILASKRKFSRIPFLSTHSLRNRKIVAEVVKNLLAGE